MFAWCCLVDALTAGNPRVHKEALKKCLPCAGESSLQNALELAFKNLR